MNLDIDNFDSDEFDGYYASDYNEICVKLLAEHGSDGKSEKIKICNKLVRNLQSLSDPEENANQYQCVCLSSWLYKTAQSSHVTTDFLRDIYRDLGKLTENMIPFLNECNHNNFEVINTDPEKLIKFYSFSISINKIKSVVRLGKSYDHHKALIEYVNECIDIYKRYINTYSGPQCDNALCDELLQFEELYEELKSEFSESEYNIPELQNTPGKNVEKFSLKVEENALSPRDRGVQTDGEIAPGGMSTSKIVTMGSLIYVPAVSFYVFKFSPLKHWLRGIAGKKSRISSDIGELTEQLQNDYEIEYLNSDDSQFHIGYHSANY
ncbi:PIR protein [Plasmodium vivax]|uniref:VIR protein n=1 Tax=Plasmodium vivax TaxID=5855 RepID=A0A565A637_PLAVI|nr:PIR protein [Plasmodium vivax]